MDAPEHKADQTGRCNKGNEPVFHIYTGTSSLAMMVAVDVSRSILK
jgi:hypothetical protein